MTPNRKRRIARLAIWALASGVLLTLGSHLALARLV